jgi:excinuclease ABC subunit A
MTIHNIHAKGVRTHNLKNIEVELPRDKLIVITGLSGSGKSSLAFDTLYAEGQRRYVESLSAYARQFLSVMEKPDVDWIEGLSPAISIEQKATSHNPRSTVGTITEIYDYLRLFYARVGIPRCPEHAHELTAQTVSQMVDSILALEDETPIMILAPVVRERKGEYSQLFLKFQAQGYIRARVDGEMCELDVPPELDLHKKHDIDVVVDRIKVRDSNRQRIAESLESALLLADGLASISFLNDDTRDDLLFSANFACPDCGYSIEELSPRCFSFNNPKGACSECDGLGVSQYFDENKIIVNDELSLSGGAIRGWDKRNVYYYQLLLSLSKHYGFSLVDPYKSLSPEIKSVLLYGSGDEDIEFCYLTQGKKEYKRVHAFEGVIPNLKRRYRKSDSAAVRDDIAKYLVITKCRSCDGARLCESSRHVYIEGTNLPYITGLSIKDALAYFNNIKLSGIRLHIADKIITEISARLGFLVDVGLDYLSLERSAETLSGGEAQRIRLASQIGSGLVGVMYILDEPSIGLHQRDNQRLLKTLVRLRDLGNTVIVVEHDEDAILAADYVVDLGPGAGVHGGEVVAMGTPQEIIAEPESLTGQYLSGAKKIEVPMKRVPITCRKYLKITGANLNNLNNLTLEIPLGLFTCVTGVSGSGKSSLISNTLYPLAAKELNRASSLIPGPYDKVTGLDDLDKVVEINQSPIGRTPRSNPATYSGLFTPIRELFAQTEEARARGYKAGRFSFNVKGGRCESCEGDGVIKVEMHFLADVYVTCDLCKGKRYNRETLDVLYKGKNIHDVLQMTIEQATEFFVNVPVVKRKLDTLIQVGLSYITLGQRATTLSGGEAQRVKLAKELSKRSTGSTLYVLDEPTTGLHFHDIKKLMEVLLHLRDHGNTLVIIEHNLDVIKMADWIIDMGPEGGDGGGDIVVCGSPEVVVKHPVSHTGKFLKDVLYKS